MGVISASVVCNSGYTCLKNTTRNGPIFMILGCFYQIFERILKEAYMYNNGKIFYLHGACTERQTLKLPESLHW